MILTCVLGRTKWHKFKKSLQILVFQVIVTISAIIASTSTTCTALLLISWYFHSDTFQNTAAAISSCQYITGVSPSSLIGYFWVSNGVSSPVLVFVYCTPNRHCCSSANIQGWPISTWLTPAWDRMSNITSSTYVLSSVIKWHLGFHGCKYPFTLLHTLL